MHVLLTGGAGFIGSHLTDALLARGYSVTCVDDLSMGSVENIRHNLDHPRYSFLQFDIRDLSQLLSAGEGCDAVAHLAAFKIPRYSSAYQTLTINIEGARCALELARVNKAKFVLASTSDVYGKNPRLPFHEESDLLLGPSTSRRWSYAVTKLYDEHLSYAYQDEYDLRVAILRYFGAYGERQYLDWWGGPQGVFLEAIAKDEPIEIHGEGTQTRCFIYIKELAEATARAIERDSTNGEILNIGTAEEISIIDMARLMHRLSGVPGDLNIRYVPYSALSKNYEDVNRRVPDLTKMVRLLEFEPGVSLEEGMKRLWDWYWKSRRG
jgi:UDP-glucose 4-epimerase